MPQTLNAPDKQPTEAQELADARYVHRVKVQADLVEVLSSRTVPLDRANWWILRFQNAYAAELEAERVAAGLKPPSEDALTGP